MDIENTEELGGTVSTFQRAWGPEKLPISPPSLETEISALSGVNPTVDRGDAIPKFSNWI